MTSSNPNDFGDAVEVVKAILALVADPNIRRQLEELRKAGTKALEIAEREETHPEKEAAKGTCPSCGKTYSITKEGYVRRHRDTLYGNPKCQFDKQAPAEIIPAILAIARMGESSREVSDGRAQNNSPD
jgi:predicted RNA-binding Zn-ribbon protein involved in translation (DUF1610 family)